MKNDPVVEEIREHRQALFARYGNDRQRFFEAMKASEKQSKLKLSNPGPRLILKSTGS